MKLGGLPQIPSDTQEAVAPNSITLEEDYQDLGTFCGAGYKSQLLIHVCRVLVSPVSAAAVPWYMTNGDRNPPPQADCSHFCLTSRKGIGINTLEGTNFLEPMPSARQ